MMRQAGDGKASVEEPLLAKFASQYQGLLGEERRATSIKSLGVIGEER